MLTGSSAHAVERAATLKEMKGEVAVLRDQVAIPVTEGMTLFPQDVIRTARNAKVGVCFVDGSRMSLGPNSELTVVDYVFVPGENKTAFDVFLRQGTSVYSSGQISKMAPETIRIATPQMVLGARNSKLLLKVD